MNPDINTITLNLYIPPEQQEQYLLLPFDLPDGVEELRLSYEYQRHEWQEEGPERVRRVMNVIDIGLIAPDGQQAGATGSYKSHFGQAACFTE